MEWGCPPNLRLLPFEKVIIQLPRGGLKERSPYVSDGAQTTSYGPQASPISLSPRAWPDGRPSLPLVHFVNQPFEGAPILLPLDRPQYPAIAHPRRSGHGS